MSQNSFDSSTILVDTAGRRQSYAFDKEGEREALFDTPNVIQCRSYHYSKVRSHNLSVCRRTEAPG